MVASLPQPGVEVVQEFASASPTIVTPTLVPCNIAPFFEVIEALNSDGTVNSDAKLATLYEQLEQTILQAAFPSPRDNIDEVDVVEDSIRVFFEFGGALQELLRTSAFLTSFNDPDVATQPSIDGSTTEASTTGGYDVDARTVILNIDSHTALPPTAGTLPAAADVTVTLVAATPAGRLTLDEIVTQINAVLPGVASRSVAGGTGVLRLTSTRFGAGASVVVRADSTANDGTDRLGFDASSDNLAVGSGFYASDDSDGDLESPRLKVYEGNDQGTLAAMGTAVITVPNFLDANIEAGDDVIAEGIAIGQVSVVESGQLTMETEQNIIAHDAKFAPRRVRVQANNLVFPGPGASDAATLLGTVQTAAAAVPFVVPQAVFAGAADPAESIDVDVTIAGVAQATETVSSGAGDWATISAAITDINGQAVNFETYPSNDVGDEVDASVGTYIGFRTTAAISGSGASLTIAAGTATALTILGFTSVPLADIGENIRFLSGTRPVHVGAAAFVGGGGVTAAQTIIYTPTVNTVVKGAETIVWGATVSGDAPGLTTVVADWNSQALYTEAYEADSAGVESATGTYFAIRSKGENFGTGATIDVTATDTQVTLTVATISGTDVDLNTTNFQWSVDGNPKVYDIVFVADEDDGGTALQTVLDQINAETPNIATASSALPPFLELTSQKMGEASKLLIGSGTGTTLLGFTAAQVDVGNGRPEPDLGIDINGSAVLQSQVLRSPLTGVPFNPGFAPVLVTYKGLRLDLSPAANDPQLLIIDDITTLTDAASPISADNPGSLMTFLSLLNAPAVSVAAIGVDEISDDAPLGTPAGYARSAEFLESEEVYALATASQISTVHQTFQTHVNVMSEPEQKGERIYFFNPVIPTRDNPDLIGSGTDLNTTATANEATLDVNIAPALVAAGLDPESPLNPSSGVILNEVYLDIAGDDNLYLVEEVDNGTILTLRTAFVAGDGNDDSFFSTEAFPTTVISDDWSVFIRGASLLVPGTARPDRQAQAETVQAAAAAIGFRRSFYVFPDQVGINITGLEQLVEGFYATAAIVGMVGQQPPQQGFTNFPITGLTRVVGSNDKFTNSQLNIIAAGGVYTLIQPVQGAPVSSRHQLSTDTTAIETRELSITKVVDFTAKFMRGGLRNFIGRSNVTQGFLDNLSTIIQGQLNFLTEGGVLIGADINNIIQDADNPDTILVDITLDVPFPANYIRLTLVV